MAGVPTARPYIDHVPARRMSRRPARAGGPKMTASFFAALVLATCVSAANGDDSAAGQGVQQVTVNPRYAAGGAHSWLWGHDYRALWTQPIQVEVLDLQGFAGGLTPAFRVGG